MLSRKGIENQLFTWDGWDEAASDAQDSIYYGVQLTSPVGEFPAGHRFSFCNFMPSECLVEFFDNKEDENGHVFRLKLSVEKV
jgi:hypothetical protein